MRLGGKAAKVQKPATSSLFHRFGRHCSHEVIIEKCYIPILICSFISGFCDGASFPSYNVFLSMQTGNTIFFAGGAAGFPQGQPLAWVRSLISVASFIVGGICFDWIGRRVGHKRIGYLFGSFFIQSIFLITGASIIQSGIVPERDALNQDGSYYSIIRFKERIPVALVSFQFAAQLIHAQTLGADYIPTVVLTSVYMGICRDKDFFKTDNAKRNKRLIDVVVTVVGAIAGPWMVRSSAGLAGVFWISAGIKMMIAIAWLFWEKEKTMMVEAG